MACYSNTNNRNHHSLYVILPIIWSILNAIKEDVYVGTFECHIAMDTWIECEGRDMDVTQPKITAMSSRICAPAQVLLKDEDLMITSSVAVSECSIGGMVESPENVCIWSPSFEY